MRQLFLSLIAILFFVSSAVADTGLVSVKSSHSVKKTADRLESTLGKKGMTVFIRINHAEGASKVGKKLRPTELIIFGNPKVGTPLMLCAQTAALDLPQKALAYKDEKGQTWLAYNDPAYVANRHDIKGCKKPLQRISSVLAKFARIATE